MGIRGFRNASWFFVVDANQGIAVAAGGTRKTKLKKELKKAGAKTTDDVEFEDLFGRDPEPEPVRT